MLFIEPQVTVILSQAILYREVNKITMILQFPMSKISAALGRKTNPFKMRSSVTSWGAAKLQPWGVIFKVDKTVL